MRSPPSNPCPLSCSLRSMNSIFSDRCQGEIIWYSFVCPIISISWNRNLKHKNQMMQKFSPASASVDEFNVFENPKLRRHSPVVNIINGEIFTLVVSTSLSLEGHLGANVLQQNTLKQEAWAPVLMAGNDLLKMLLHWYFY